MVPHPGQLPGDSPKITLTFWRRGGFPLRPEAQFESGLCGFAAGRYQRAGLEYYERNITGLR